MSDYEGMPINWGEMERSGRTYTTTHKKWVSGFYR